MNWKWLIIPSLFSIALAKYCSTGAGFGKPVTPSRLMCLPASSRHIASKVAPIRPAFLKVSAKALWPASPCSQSDLATAFSCLTALSRITITGLVSTSFFSAGASAGASPSSSLASRAVGSVSPSGTSVVKRSTTSERTFFNARFSSGVSSSFLIPVISESPLLFSIELLPSPSSASRWTSASVGLWSIV